MYNLFWSSVNHGRIFKVFSMEHILGVSFVLLILFSIFQFKGCLIKKDRQVRLFMAIGLFIQQLLLYGWYISSGSFSLSESLPLYTCRIAILFSIVMLINKSYKIFEFVYFWGVVGGIIALITPDTSSFTFPHFMFDQYFLGHGLLLGAVFYMMVIHGYRVTEKSLIKTFKITVLYAICIIPINFLLKGNYSYLNGKPDTSTLLDLLPPYPYYVPIFIAIMFSFFYMVYLPFREEKVESVEALID